MNNFKNLSVLITGGSGFIGSHLVERLVELNSKVTVIDNLSSGDLKNITNIIDKINFIRGDITDFDLCLKASKNKDIIFHLAAFVSVPKSIKYPDKCNKININGTLNLLESARINKVQKFIFSSSSAVYGIKEGKCSEEDHCAPISVYGYSKLIGEILCKQYAQLYNIKTVCLRYFNVYGPRQNHDEQYAAVIAKFKNLMKNNMPITIYGDGKQKRDFISVDDVVKANIILSTLQDNHLNGQSINIATGKSITLLQLFEKLKLDYPNYNLNPIFESARAGDVLLSEACCNKYRSLIINYL